MESQVRAKWAAVWPWLAVVAMLALAKVPALYLQPERADALVIFEDAAGPQAAALIGQ